MTLTNSTLVELIAVLLFTLACLVVVSSARKIKPKQQPITYATNTVKVPKTKAKEKHEEVIDTLDWMLQNQIINTTEYNQLITKSLPFLG